MKKDRTIKILLAVIAINLSLISLNQLNIFPKAFANTTISTELKPQEFGLVPLKLAHPIRILILYILMYFDIPCHSNFNIIPDRYSR